MTLKIVNKNTCIIESTLRNELLCIQLVKNPLEQTLKQIKKKNLRKRSLRPFHLALLVFPFQSIPETAFVEFLRLPGFILWFLP